MAQSIPIRIGTQSPPSLPIPIDSPRCGDALSGCDTAILQMTHFFWGIAQVKCHMLTHCHTLDILHAALRQK